jgi:long-chain fatty acid transport protein
MSKPARGLGVAAGLGVGTGLAVLLGAPAPAPASGFSIFEQGGRSMGFAGAYTAVTDDPSAIFFNAAGLAFLEGTQLYVGGALVMPESSFSGTNPFPGLGVQETQRAGWLPVPALYFSHRLSPRFAWGIGLDAPFALKTKWASPDTFTGRYIAVESSVRGFALNPTIALRLNDKVSLGAGVDLRFSSVRLVRRAGGVDPFTQTVKDTAEVVLDSDPATGVGFDVGVVAKPRAGLSLGAQYRHKVKIDYSGTATFTRIPTGNDELDASVASRLPQGTPAVETSIEYPSILSAGVARDWRWWTVAADVVFFQWSTFDQLPLTFPTEPGLDSVIPEGYRNSWQVRAGVERRLEEGWALRLGYHYDRTPVPTESVSPILPDSDTHCLAVGWSWTSTSRHVFVDGGLWYLFLRQRSTEGQNRDGYNGTYENAAFSLGASLGYRF